MYNQYTETKCNDAVIDKFVNIEIEETECAVQVFFCILFEESFYWNNRRRRKEQAGAELCQAQMKLGLAKPPLNGKKMRWTSIVKYIDVVFHLP